MESNENIQGIRDHLGETIAEMEKDKFGDFVLHADEWDEETRHAAAQSLEEAKEAWRGSVCVALRELIEACQPESHLKPWAYCAWKIDSRGNRVRGLRETVYARSKVEANRRAWQNAPRLLDASTVFVEFVIANGPLPANAPQFFDCEPVEAGPIDDQLAALDAHARENPAGGGFGSVVQSGEARQ